MNLFRETKNIYIFRKSNQIRPIRNIHSVLHVNFDLQCRPITNLELQQLVKN